MNTIQKASLVVGLVLLSYGVMGLLHDKGQPFVDMLIVASVVYAVPTLILWKLTGVLQHVIKWFKAEPHKE